MLRRVTLVLVALLALAPFLPAFAQEDIPVVLRLEGHEGPLACDPTALELLCFETAEGDPASAFTAGATVRVELTAVPLDGAPAGAPHNLAVILDGDQGDLSGIDSDSSNAIAISDTAESGDTVTLEFTVPDSGTLYFWCDVGEHEFAGMNFQAEVQPAVAVDDGEDADDNTTAGSGTDDNGTAGDAPMADDGNSTADGNATMETQGANENETDASAEGPAGVEESPGLPVLLIAALALVSFAARRTRDD